jgi:hypothetical protein
MIDSDRRQELETINKRQTDRLTLDFMRHHRKAEHQQKQRVSNQTTRQVSLLKTLKQRFAVLLVPGTPSF